MVPSAKPESLIKATALPAANHYFLALSGGLDSIALLHHLVQDAATKAKLTAIHVNHNIHPEANQWANHCAWVCDVHGVPLITCSVNLPNTSEDAARTGRYQALGEVVGEQDVLVTAHHLNDQLETVLFRLLRGTGLHGLTAMQAISHKDHYRLCRPLLQVSREQLERYAHNHQLSWVEDPSNGDPRYSRNRLRQQVIPALLDYHPDSMKNLAQTHQNLTHSLALLQQLVGTHNPLPITQHKQPEHLATVLYHWLHILDLIPPKHPQLNQYARDCLQAAPDRSPLLEGSGYQLLLWQNQIHALQVLDADPKAQWSHTLQAGREWTLPSGQGGLLLESDQAIQLDVQVRFQQAGERMLLVGQQHHKKLKKLFQEQTVPPWVRDVMPMLYVDGQLMACGDQFISQSFARLLSQHNAEYHWRSPQFLL